MKDFDTRIQHVTKSRQNVTKLMFGVVGSAGCSKTAPCMATAVPWVRASMLPRHPSARWHTAKVVAVPSGMDSAATARVWRVLSLLPPSYDRLMQLLRNGSDAAPW